MVRLSDFAISIAELQGIFGADSEFADELRNIAEAALPAPVSKPPSRKRLLNLFAPLTKKSIEPPVLPDRPAPPDIEALLSAHAIMPKRRPYAWQIVLVWLHELSWGSLDLEVTDAQLSALEFTLAACGLPSQFGLEKLALRDTGIPLLPLPGEIIGYNTFDHVLGTEENLRRSVDGLSPRTREAIVPFQKFLANFHCWG